MPKLRIALVSVTVVVGIIVAAVVTLNVVLTDAIVSHQRNSTCPHVKALRTYQQWLQSVTFPYTAPSERVRQVVNNYGQVEIGSSEKKVVEALGSPDFEQDIIPKEPWRPCVGYEYAYYFQKSDGEPDNELKDRRLSKIEISFTADGKVYWIGGTIAGLPHKGSSLAPTGPCCSSK